MNHSFCCPRHSPHYQSNTFPTPNLFPHQNIQQLQKRNRDKRQMIELRREKGGRRLASLSRKLERVKMLYREQEGELRRLKGLLGR